jgi:hypothetical protein
MQQLTGLAFIIPALTVQKMPFLCFSAIVSVENASFLSRYLATVV